MELNKKIRKQFPWFKNNKDWIYFDNGATTLKPQCVIDKINEYYLCYSTNSHNNDSPLANKVNNILSQCRINISNFIGAKENEIIFTSGATEGLNIIIDNLSNVLKKDDEVLITYTEHSSNLLPWIKNHQDKKFKLIYSGSDMPSTEQILKNINKKTKIISICDVSNLFGYKLDIKTIVQEAKKINKDVIVIIDATQSIPHQKTNVKDLDIDFLVCSAHKMCGPTGIGLIYAKNMNLINNFNVGGGSVNRLTNELEYELVEKPYSIEAGTPNIAGIIGWSEAINFLNNIGIDKIHDIEKELKQYFLEALKNVNNIKIFSYNDETPIIAFNLDKFNPQDVATYLGQNKIIVRSGLSCVKLQHKITNIEVGFVRISLYFYNTKEEIDIFIKTLKQINDKNIINYII